MALLTAGVMCALLPLCAISPPTTSTFSILCCGSSWIGRIYSPPASFQPNFASLFAPSAVRKTPPHSVYAPSPYTWDYVNSVPSVPSGFANVYFQRDLYDPEYYLGGVAALCGRVLFPTRAPSLPRLGVGKPTVLVARVDNEYGRRPGLFSYVFAIQGGKDLRSLRGVFRAAKVC